MNKYLIIETTYPNINEAKALGEVLLKRNLASCLQFHEINSIYSWQGELQNDHEILVRIKTKNSLYELVEKIIKKHHSYKVPEIISTQINKGSKAYFDWLETSTEISSK